MFITSASILSLWKQ